MRWILSLLSMSDRLFSMSSIEMSVSTLSLLSSLVLNFTISLSRCLSFSCIAYMRVLVLWHVGFPGRSVFLSSTDTRCHTGLRSYLFLYHSCTSIINVVLSGLVLRVFVHAAALSRSRASTYSVLFFLSTFCSCWAVFLALESPTSSILCFDWGLFVPN